MKTLVVVDPDALTRTLISECVAGQDWVVFEAENGQAGVDLVLKHRPTAVMCDLRTPKRNGFQVARLIREQPSLNDTRIILMTVSRFANDRETAFQSGADDYLLKPIVPNELLVMLAPFSKNGDAAPVEAEAEAPPAGPTLIRFWGVRGSIPTPGRETSVYGGNTSCVEVRVGNEIIILDAGSGIRRLGQSLMQELSTNGGLKLNMLITHTHWDHIQGFPFFIPAYHPSVDIRILGYEGAVHGLRGALFEQMTSAFFPVGLNQMATHLTFEELDDMQFDLGAVKVKTIFANHPGICLGYRLTTPAGDVIYMPDHEAYERCERERQTAEKDTSEHGLEYARIQDEKVIEFMRGADVIIADSQYDAIEYPTRRGWGHTCADDTVQLAIRAGAKRLFLFHHDPDHNDEKLEVMVARGREAVSQGGSKLAVLAAKEGEEVLLQPNEN